MLQYDETYYNHMKCDRKIEINQEMVYAATLSTANGQSAAKENNTMNIKQFQVKVNNKYLNEDLTVLQYGGARGEKGSTIIKCNCCGAEYSFVSGGSAIRKNKIAICQNCGIKNKKQHDFEEFLKQRFPEDNLEVLEFNLIRNPGIIRCNNCGTIYSFQSMGSVYKKTRDKFCSICFPHKQDIMNEKIKEFSDFIKQNDTWTLNQSIKNIHSHDLVECICTKCGNASSKTIYDYLRGRGCLYCSGNNQKTTEQFKQELDDEYELLTEYVNANTKIKLKHCCGFVYEVTPHNYLTGKRCPKCSRHQSKGEKLIEQYLIDHQIDYFSEVPMRIDNHLLRFDFYLPEQDLYIEFQGIQHFEPIQHFGGIERFKKQQQFDNLKKHYATNLLEIDYTQINRVDEILDNILKVQRPSEKSTSQVIGDGSGNLL